MAKKILLLFPNTSNEGVLPLAIAILSFIAKQAGFEVRYFETSFYRKRNSAAEERERTGEFKPVDRDNFFNLRSCEFLQKDFQEILDSYQPDILAVSANSLEYKLFCELIERVMPAGTKPFVIVGGVHATVSPDDVINNPSVDALCIGEGEKVWEEFLEKFKNGKDISCIENLWLKNKQEIKKNPLRPLLSEYELWKNPLDLSLFDDRHIMSPFDGKMYRRGQVELSRGCPYNCSYCVNSAFKEIYKGLGKFFRVRPFDNLQEAIKNRLQAGCNMLQLQDECFFSVQYPALERFCKWYQKVVRIPLLLQTRPESVTVEKVKLLADMGVPVQVSCGVESGSQRILRNICNRSTKIEQIKNAFHLIKKYNLRSTAYTMIGFPTETRAEVFETIHLIRECKIDISIMSIFFPFQGVPLRKYCLENNYITGREEARTFTDASILLNQPMSQQEIYNLRRTYSLYTRLPEEYFPQIELCERDYENHKGLFKELVLLMDQKYYNAWKLE